ncbi:type VI secretion system tube protein TssD [Pandoraea sp.]|uniref:type VI secretion system tube protein TssD n=1 Tax=Pandoraea sp. TaxID=1883445 RepID=UPI0035B3AC3C
MAIPGYMFLSDDAGKKIEGSVTVKGREGSVELVAYAHNVYIPTDGNTGKLTGTRVHKPYLLTKAKDRSSPELYKALTSGKTLQTVTIREYEIDGAGKEEEYFTTVMENVKVVSINAKMLDIKVPDYEKHNHLEEVELRYETIQWKYADGNIQHKDSWNERGGNAA